MGYTWGAFEENMLEILEHSQIMSCAWKTLGSNDLTIKALPDYSSYKPGLMNDYLLVKEIWDVLDQSDIVIAHHGLEFDIKKLNTRFVFHSMNAPSYYQVIDTKKVASKHFKFASNSLNNLGKYFGVGTKKQNEGFGLWMKCMLGDKEAWKTMKEYNGQDVTLLENVYLKLRPFMSSHPNLNLIADTGVEGACGSCQSTSTIKRGFQTTKLGKKQRYQCLDCGSWSLGAWQRRPLMAANDNVA